MKNYEFIYKKKNFNIFTSVGPFNKVNCSGVSLSNLRCVSSDIMLSNLNLVFSSH